MWVMNQDGISVIQAEALSIDYRDVVASQDKDVDKRPKMYRVWGQVAGGDYVMGTYRTLEEAKEVIADFYGKMSVEGTKFYKMPESIDNEGIA